MRVLPPLKEYEKNLWNQMFKGYIRCYFYVFSGKIVYVEWQLEETLDWSDTGGYNTTTLK